MKSELKEISPTEKEIILEINADTVKESYGKVSKKYASKASVPGFRRGYAPLDVVRLRFKEEIKSEVLQDVVPSAVTAAIQEHKLHPLAEPHLHLDDQETVKVNGSVPLLLHVHLQVMPELPEPKYDGIEVTRRVKPVADGEIEDLIAERLQREAALMPVEGRKSKIGDTVIADLEGRFADSPDGDPIRAEDLEVELGGEHIEKSFTENLVGVKEDEEKEFTVQYPKEFSSEALAGKTVHYKAKIKSVGKMEVPKLDDEWAMSLDEGYESLADLRKRLKADLEKVSEADADARVSNNAIAKLIEDNSFEVPGVLIENQARNLLNNFAQDMQQRGVDLNQVEPQFIEMAYGNMRQQAERDVQGAMLLDKVAELEKVDVSDGEVDEEIGKMAAYYRSSADEIRESLEKQGGGVDNIRGDLKTRKAIEAIVAKAKITDGEWIDESLAKQDETEKPKKAKKKESAKKASKS
ncbi:MAG: trigger factor [Pyrinomonadaceae bacterium]